MKRKNDARGEKERESNLAGREQKGERGNMKFTIGIAWLGRGRLKQPKPSCVL